MIEGKIHPDFWSVVKVFRNQLPGRGQGGAALCIYHHGESVVDVWAGSCDENGKRWQSDTVALSYSTTKGVTSTLLHILVDQGLLDYDDTVAIHWPEFAAEGKESITVRQLMCHEAGLYDIRSMVDHASRIMDWNYMVEALAAARPKHDPGTAHGYHGLTYGWLIGELIQRVSGRSFSEVLQQRIAQPPSLDGLFIGLPPDQRHRRARLILAGIQESPEATAKLRGYLNKISRALSALGLSVDLNEVSAALLPHGIEDLDFNSDALHAASIPAANGMFTASSLARMYAALACGGELDGVRLLSRNTLERPTSPQNRGIGRVIPFPMHWRLGYHRPFTLNGSVPNGFGHFGFGGSGAWADPQRGLAVAMTLNSGVGTPFGDMRMLRISTSAARAADRRERAAA